MIIGFTTNEGTTNRYICFEEVKEIIFTYQRACEVKKGETRKAKAELYFKNSDELHKVKGSFEFIHKIENQFLRITNPFKL